MKTIKSYLTAGATMILLLCFVSCSKTFYTQANVNPNAPNSVPSSTLLSGIEVSLAYTQGGAASQFTSLFTQQTLGADRQALAYYEYILTPADPEYLWDQMYTYVMENDLVLMNQAQSLGQNEYYGIANVLMAYSLQVTVDVWGKIPYTNALQGASNTQPSYDNDMSLYTTALSLLNTGITALRNSNRGAQYPSSDDVMFGGSASAWIAFAEAIEARIYIHQCKHGNATLEQDAINAADSALADGFVNAQVYFGSAATNNGPWYQFINQRGGYIAFVGTTLTDTMIALNDPRLTVFVDTANQVLGNYYGGPASPVEFITTEELYLIVAEANIRIGNAAAAQTAYTAALNASMTKLSVPSGSASAYIAGPQGILPAGSASALHQIGLQQWIALYLNPEAWTCWRRNNAPYLQPIAGPAIVRRMIYPNSEVSLNPNCPSGVTMFVPPIFWDN